MSYIRTETLQTELVFWRDIAKLTLSSEDFNAYQEQLKRKIRSKYNNENGQRIDNYISFIDTYENKIKPIVTFEYNSVFEISLSNPYLAGVYIEEYDGFFARIFIPQNIEYYDRFRKLYCISLPNQYRNSCEAFYAWLLENHNKDSLKLRRIFTLLRWLTKCGLRFGEEWIKDMEGTIINKLLNCIEY